MRGHISYAKRQEPRPSHRFVLPRLGQQNSKAGAQACGETGWERHMAKIKGEETTKNGHDDINDRLHEAIDGLRKDVTRGSEIWATALGPFTQPVPDYSPSKKFELSSDNKITA